MHWLCALVLRLAAAWVVEVCGVPVMFERAYVLRAFDMESGINEQINAAVAEFDHERAAASIACMTAAGSELLILIEYWRHDGDSEQDTEGAVERPAKVGKSRRARASADVNSSAAPRVEPESVELPLESAADGYGHGV